MRLKPVTGFFEPELTWQENAQKELQEEIGKKEPKVSVRVIGFTDSGITIRGSAWSEDSQSSFIMGCDLNKKIKERFDKEGIDIPYPHRMIVYKNKSNIF